MRLRVRPPRAFNLFNFSLFKHPEPDLRTGGRWRDHFTAILERAHLPYVSAAAPERSRHGPPCRRQRLARSYFIEARIIDGDGVTCSAFERGPAETWLG